MRFGMLVSLALAAPAAGDIAVSVAAGAPDTVFPNTSTTHGWQFSVNAPLEVTHLGLYDRLFDGFAIAHPIGLWDEEGTLLAEDVLGPGAGDTLIDNFRYVDITDNTEGGQGVILTPGQQYTIGFFSASFNQIDGMVIFDGFHTVNPAVDYVGFGVADVTGGLQMPVTPDEFGLHRWGPNFQFTVIPTPAGAAVLLVPFFAAGRRRPRFAAGRRRPRINSSTPSGCHAWWSSDRHARVH
jgi:hypothetical protein